MTPPSWSWRGRRRKPNEQAAGPAPGGPPEGPGTGSASPVEGDGAQASSGDGLPAAPQDGEGDGPVPAERSDAAGAPSSVRVDVSGEGAVGAGRDVAHSAIGAGSRVEHTEVDNRIDHSTVHGDVYQAGNLTVTHHHPPPPTGPVRRPVRVGTVPPLASAFQSRPGLQEQIDRARERNATVVLTQVLSGGGGVGKSQLAAFCVHRAHTDGVDVLVWVDATEITQIISTYAEAAAKAGVPGADGQDAERDAAAFLEWLAVTDRSWLVVLDDLTDLENTGPWWPHPPAGTNGRVLATTRRRDALVTGSGRAIVDIGTYTTDEALAYLRERLGEAGAGHLLDDRADDLIVALGGLPLALAHAAAYMINEDADCATYLRLFTDRASRLETLLPPGADTDGYGRQVTASLLLALDAAQQREPVGLAVPAIRLAAHLDPAGHPDTLWATDAATGYLTTHRIPPPPGTSDPDPVTAGQARAALRLLHHYALINHDTHDTNRAVRLHALTARATRETTPPTQLPATVHAAADALAETWPEHEHTARDLTTVLRANTDTLTTHADNHLWHPNGHPLLFTAGTSLNNTGLFGVAVTHWQSLAADAERLLGGEHPDTLSARAGLAVSYRQAGRTGEATDLQERVLADCVRLLGGEHPDTLSARAGLAVSYWQAGRTGEAIVLEERVLADYVRLLGGEHPDTLSARANLAASYYQAGRTGEATDLLERVLADRERLLGGEHPHTLSARAGLAASYWQAGRTGEAIVLEERVLVDRERLLGEEHPDTLSARANLAASYYQAGRTGEAIDLVERVLADCLRLLGGEHPHTLTTRANLAASYRQAGRTGEAIVLEERVLVDRERLLGEEHPDTLSARANLAASYWQAGRMGEATDLLERVLADRERVLGHDHPDTRAAADRLRSWRNPLTP
ncbi:Tetratricopeptide repeat-containing protein [Streptomyces sp. TLI_053]|uniref:tetratricopeptide repeat protein n=1 Tax=Streptomyces sp. TLI_053 TaxID=1855352 RepID=UPI000879BCD1|nr:tetratricopeptide repeat protein [Streptomyces sp. TLI_053]SDT83483.1 Tetratricopeptide repeat-containing protein [Streptomyces sp. TLI_053]